MFKLGNDWRRLRDSNPRGLAPKRFSRPPRYDHFDKPPQNIQVVKTYIFYIIIKNFASVFKWNFYNSEYFINLTSDFEKSSSAKSSG